MFCRAIRWPHLLGLLLTLSPLSSLLAAPTLVSMAPRGLRIGQPVTVTLSGAEFSADTRLILPVKIASQAVKGDVRPDRVELEVTLDASVQPGIYPLRIATAGGISNPILIGVDKLPQVPHNPAEPVLGELPLALHGTVGGGEVLKLKLTGKKDQRLVLDVEALRIGSGLKPVIRLYGNRGAQIAWSPPRSQLGGDARVVTTLPADGEYSVELHDQLFRPAGPGFFRLKVGDLAYADFVLPMGAALGSKQSVKFASSNLPSGAEFDGTALTVPGEVSAPLPPADNFTGRAPRFFASEIPELLEAPAAAGSLQELPQPPLAITGVIGQQREEDKFLLNVTPGQRLRLDVISRQVGARLDGVLYLRNEQGGELAVNEDRPGSSDPLLDYTVPADVSKVVVHLRDLQLSGGADFVYRVAIRDLARPDFSLSLTTDRINVPAGGTQVIPVQVTRTNYGGPIELSLDGLPPQYQLQGNVIPAGATIGLLTVTAQPGSPQAGLTRLIGRAVEAQPPVVRLASFAEYAGAKHQPRVLTEIGLATASPSPINLAWVSTENDKLVLGSKLPAKVQFTRAEGTPGNVRVRLLTSQPMPKKTIKENNQDKVVDDLDRALRLEGDPVFPPEQKEVTVNLLVPADLPQQPWDLVLVADLLAADGKTTLSSIAAPVRTLTPLAPIALELVSPPQVDGKAGAGETGKLAGKVTRAAGYAQPVVITLDNLPKGYSAPQVLVAANKSDFELPVVFAYGSPAGALKGVKLVALSAPATAASVRSNAIEVAINVVPGEKPAAEPPKEIFEDDEKFIAMLTEGDGKAIPEMRDKYSGTSSVRVTPNQKLNAALPSLGVKIRENPGPGEYRYLRFAWKKAGGNSICLQLNHDGTWGPGGTGREGAKFRYHAGPGGECYGASLVISDELPTKFELVTRDLFADFGEFTLTGLALSPVDGNAALFDHLYLGRQAEDFSLLKVEK